MEIISAENAVSASIEVVRRHFSALAVYDWPTLKSSVSGNADLRLVGVSNFAWMPTSLYRHITQAWDLPVLDVELTDEGGGIVRARIHLANDLLTKTVEGEYRVVMAQIDAITLTDAMPAKAEER